MSVSDTGSIGSNNSVFLAIQRDPSKLEIVKPIYKDDLSIVGAAVRRDGLLLRFAGPVARDNEGIAEEAIAQNPEAIQYVSERVQKVFEERKRIAAAIAETDKETYKGLPVEEL